MADSPRSDLIRNELVMLRCNQLARGVNKNPQSMSDNGKAECFLESTTSTLVHFSLHFESAKNHRKIDSHAYVVCFVSSPKPYTRTRVQNVIKKRLPTRLRPLQWTDSSRQKKPQKLKLELDTEKTSSWASSNKIYIKSPHFISLVGSSARGKLAKSQTNFPRTRVSCLSAFQPW